MNFGLWWMRSIVNDAYEYDLYGYEDDWQELAEFGIDMQNRNTIEFSTDSISAIKVEPYHLNTKYSYIYMKLRNQPQFSQLVNIATYDDFDV